jgi:ABC-type thiamine transport system ATPase subunit
MQRVKNISRLSMCQVKENLRLRYEDAERIPACCAAILQEIRGACPNAITDGTRPFRAVLRAFERDHLVVMVDVHFVGIKPIGSAYWNNRQEALLAIHRAVAKSQCQFVTTPAWPAVPLLPASTASSD